VRRGRPPPFLRGGELVTGGGRSGPEALCAPPPGATPASAGAARGGIRFPPLCSPGCFRRARGPRLGAGCRLGRPGGVLAPEVQLFSVPGGWVSPDALLIFGQGPAVFRAQPFATAPGRRRERATWLGANAVACAAPGVGRRHEPPWPRCISYEAA
jgi:hypothetical protein